ncbi:hypothetical protein POPTR_005G149001v4 [Populus trichocarpa]|uniref:Uncharacterized protein n=1 Tax=Populus trichocarpa TaxID=3694 RepID=A0ACC0SZY3_POPTR|nr:hypothetical protein BDE02_05G126400 [Populus trichocarpa]KAI9394858.1 hypothetical protein POPTR_005G149001v4 [Populus trichocarpa]
MIVYSYEYIGDASLVSIELHIAHGSLMVMVNRRSECQAPQLMSKRRQHHSISSWGSA